MESPAIGARDDFRGAKRAVGDALRQLRTGLNISACWSSVTSIENASFAARSIGEDVQPASRSNEERNSAATRMSSGLVHQMVGIDKSLLRGNRHERISLILRAELVGIAPVDGLVLEGEHGVSYAKDRRVEAPLSRCIRRSCPLLSLDITH